MSEVQAGNVSGIKNPQAKPFWGALGPPGAQNLTKNFDENLGPWGGAAASAEGLLNIDTLGGLWSHGVAYGAYWFRVCGGTPRPTARARRHANVIFCF